MIREALELFVEQVRLRADAERERVDHEKVRVMESGLPFWPTGKLDRDLCQLLWRREPLPPSNTQIVEQVSDIDSLVSALRVLGAGERTVVYVGDARVVAVLDVDGWRRRRVSMPLTLSEPFSFWSPDRTMAFEDALVAIAEHANLVEPTPVSGNELLSAFGDIEIVHDQRMSIRHSSSSVQISTLENRRAGKAGQTLPAEFHLALPVFDLVGADRVTLPVRVTAKFRDTNLFIRFSPVGASTLRSLAREALAQDVFSKIGDGLKGVTVLRGAPGEPKLIF
ncbi:MAG: hypothetical protein ACPGVG_00435 [Mycobacterium sp.]